MLSIQVRAVARNILSDHQQLLDSGRGQLRRLVQKLLQRTAPVLAPQ